MATKWGVLQRVQLCLWGLVGGVLAIGAYSLWGLRSAGDRFDDYAQGANVRSAMVDGLQHNVNLRAIAIRNALLTAIDVQGPGNTSAARESHASVGKAIAAVQRLQQHSDTPAELALAAAGLLAVEARYAVIAEALVRLIDRGDHAQALQVMREGCQPALVQLEAAVQVYKDANATLQATQAREADEAFAQQRTLTMLLGSLALTGALFGAHTVRRQIYRALGTDPETLCLVARRVAQGDLMLQVNLSRAHPQSVLSAFGEMMAKLSGLVRDVRHSSHQIALGSSELSVGNHSLAKRTDTQASSLQQTSASMSEITKIVRHYAESAQDALVIARHASESAHQGALVVRQVVDSMQRISKDSGQINDIIAVIDGIAFQTNMLALNAAVEAARAGENGKGFAVVAGEVRALAKRSADAAKEINALISNSRSEIQRGAAHAHGAGQAMEGLVGQVQSVSGLIEQMTTGATAQSASIGEMVILPFCRGLRSRQVTQPWPIAAWV